MYGDTKYEWVKSGSTTASAATAHSLFGAYNGLSLLNNDDVLHVQIMPVTNNLEILSGNDLGAGMLFDSGQTYYYDLPPVSVSTAKSLHFRNQTGASNSSVRFVAWRRIG